MERVNWGGVHDVGRAWSGAAENDPAISESFLTRLHLSWKGFQTDYNAENILMGNDRRLMISRFPQMLVFQVLVANPTTTPEKIDGYILRMPITYNHKQNTFDVELSWLNPLTKRQEDFEALSYQNTAAAIQGLRVLCVAALRTSTECVDRSCNYLDPVDRALAVDMMARERALAKPEMKV